MSEKKLPKRDEIKVEDTWKLEDIFASDDEWQKEFLEIEDGIGKIKEYKGKIAESADSLYNFMKIHEKYSLLTERVYVYAAQRMHQDTANAKYQEMAGKAQSLMVRLSEAESFFEPELLAMDEEAFTKLMQDEKMSFYTQYFENIRRSREHVLSTQMEEVLAQVDEIGEGASDIFSMLNNADMKFPSIEGENHEMLQVTHGRYISLLENKNRNIREAAFKSLYSTYEAYKNTLAAIYQTNVKKNVFFAKVRKYNSAREMALDASNIPLSVYDNLIESVHAHLPLMYKYIKIRKKMLGLDELHMYDLYTPLVKDYDVKATFDEAKEIVKKGLAPMGEEYISLLERGFNERWIDIYENEGKRSGAYSWGAYGTHPYVLLNYNSSLDNVFTLAHEMGHALHSYYSDENQEFLYAGYKIFVAEVASTCNESLLIHYLIDNAENETEKKYLINHFLEKFRGTIFRQTMFAEFEKITHEKAQAGETLTAESLCNIYYDLNKKYFGEDVVIDKEIAYEWARIPHFYTAFYVYQYATGFSAAIAISKAILAGNEEVKKGYFKFLSSGSSMYPIDLLKLCNVDMTTGQPVEAALDVFEELLEEFEKLV